VKEEERRKTYALTAKSKAILSEQVRRLEIMARIGRDTLPLLG
jgi:hypothetical protein